MGDLDITELNGIHITEIVFQAEYFCDAVRGVAEWLAVNDPDGTYYHRIDASWHEYARAVSLFVVDSETAERRRTQN